MGSSVPQSFSVVNCDCDKGIVSFSIVAIVSVCVADDIVLLWYFSFMDVMCDLLADITRIFKSSRYILESSR